MSNYDRRSKAVNPLDQTWVSGTVNKVMGVKKLNDNQKTVNDNQEDSPLNFQKILIYLFGTAFQIGAMVLTLWLVNQGFERLREYDWANWGTISLACLFWTFLTIRSRFFSPLDNTRSQKQYDQVIRPNWAPPAIAFPLVWMSIGVLRVISSYLVWSVEEHNFLAFPLIVFVIHLALGDTWNTIFTVEGRYGLAVPAVILGPLLSAFVLTFFYWQTLPLAGWLIFPSCIWLIVASALVTSIWQLNGRKPIFSN
jgi:tryptophan-rich sensory protein